LVLCVASPLGGRCAAVAKNNYQRVKLRPKIRSDFDAYMVFYETGFSELLCKYFRVEEEPNSFVE
ncbi:TPA: hypothetical protein ACYHNW_003201, partial [Vibrio cholerae]